MHSCCVYLHCILDISSLLSQNSTVQSACRRTRQAFYFTRRNVGRREIQLHPKTGVLYLKKIRKTYRFLLLFQYIEV